VGLNFSFVMGCAGLSQRNGPTDNSAVSCAKRPNRSRCRLGCVLEGAEGSTCYGGTLAQPGEYINSPCAAAMRPYIKVLWPLVITDKDHLYKGQSAIELQW